MAYMETRQEELEGEGKVLSSSGKFRFKKCLRNVGSIGCVLEGI